MGNPTVFTQHWHHEFKRRAPDFEDWRPRAGGNPEGGALMRVQAAALGIGAGILGWAWILGSLASAANEVETAEYLIKLVKAGRVVVS
jgi:hypothetical protein